eukprot:scaffold24815_cov138-Isochrysis_galbana.AAC.1
MPVQDTLLRHAPRDASTVASTDASLAASTTSHAACAFGWAKATMLPWYRAAFRENGEDPSMLLPPTLPAPKPAGAKHPAVSSVVLQPGASRAAPNASAFLHFCSVYAPPLLPAAKGATAAAGSVGGGPPSWPYELSWRACIFGAVSDLARERRAGIALLSRQAVDDRALGSRGQWRVLKAACERYFPCAPELGEGEAGACGRGSKLLASVRQLCLQALLSHATLEHYSPCGHQLLVPQE